MNNHVSTCFLGIVIAAGLGMNSVCHAQLPEMEKRLPANTTVYARVDNFGKWIAQVHEFYANSKRWLVDPDWIFGGEFLRSAKTSVKYGFSDAENKLSDCWEKVFPGKAFFALVDDGSKAVPCFGFECGEFSWHDELVVFCEQETGRMPVEVSDENRIIFQIPGRKLWWFRHNGCLFGAMSEDLIGLLSSRISGHLPNDQQETLASNRLYQRFLGQLSDCPGSTCSVYFDWRGKPIQRSFWCYDTSGNATSPPAPVPIGLVIEQTDYTDYPLCSGASFRFEGQFPVLRHVQIFEVPINNRSMKYIAGADAVKSEWFNPISRFVFPADTSSIVIGCDANWWQENGPANEANDRVYAHHSAWNHGPLQGLVFQTRNNGGMESAVVSVALAAVSDGGARIAEGSIGADPGVESDKQKRSFGCPSEGLMETEEPLRYQVIRLSGWANWDSSGLSRFLMTGDSGEVCPIDLDWLGQKVQLGQSKIRELVGIEVSSDARFGRILPTCCEVGCCAEALLKMGFGKSRDDFFHGNFLADIFLRIRNLADRPIAEANNRMFYQFHYRDSGILKAVWSSELWIQPTKEQ